MQGTDKFKEVIKAHLDQVAANDPLFAETLKKPKKNIDDCCTYVLNEVKKSGRNGYADEEIYNMAVHYYDEDDIKVGKPVSGKVVVNHKIEAKTTPVVKPAKVAKQEAVKPEVKIEPQKAVKKQKSIVQQESLFDLL